MSLEKALLYAIDAEGLGIISEARLMNYLNDLQAFDSPAVKRIVSTMVDDGYMSKLQLSINEEKYELLFNDIASQLVQTEGFQSDLVDYVMNSILYAVHKTSIAPVLPQQNKAATKPISQKKVSTRKNDMNVIQSNDNYLIHFNGQSYELDESQYKAILRKKDMPTERLEVWLKSYAEENK